MISYFVMGGKASKHRHITVCSPVLSGGSCQIWSDVALEVLPKATVLCKAASASRCSPRLLSARLGVAGSCNTGDLPIVEQEEEIGQGDSELKPPPVLEHVSHSSEDEQPHGEGQLVDNAHGPPEA